jgi:hypothetical protein
VSNSPSIHWILVGNKAKLILVSGAGSRLRSRTCRRAERRDKPPEKGLQIESPEKQVPSVNEGMTGRANVSATAVEATSNAMPRSRQ